MRAISGEVFKYDEWDLGSGRKIRTFDFPVFAGSRRTGEYSPDGTHYFPIAFPTGESQVYDLQTGKVKRLD